MSSPFPARYSTLEPKELASYVETHWAVGSGVRCTFFHRGENDNYRIECGQGKFFLRVYRTRHSHHQAVAAELNLLRDLASLGLPVSHPLESRDAQLWRTVSSVEGPRAVALFTWADGLPLKRDEPTKWDLFGQELARLHVAQPSTPSYREYASDSLLTAPANRWSERMLQAGLDPTELQRLCDHLQQEMEGLWQQLPIGFVHGDAAGGNAHVDESVQLTWFDFLWTGHGPTVWDLATFRRGAGQIKANWDLALSAYESVRILSDVERHVIPLLAAIRCVFVTSLIIDECDEDLHAEVTEDWFDRRLRELRSLVDGTHWAN